MAASLSQEEVVSHAYGHYTLNATLHQ